MGYRNKTYVIFDGDNDMWAYGFMCGWNDSDHVDFDFHNAHDLNVLRYGTAEETVKRKLRERLGNTKQAVVLIGESTRNLFRFVRWELEMCLEADVPIVAVNLNNKRRLDPELCPPVLREQPVIHVAFRAAIIRHALDDFVDHYAITKQKRLVDLYYPDAVYQRLGVA